MSHQDPWYAAQDAAGWAEEDTAQAAWHAYQLEIRELTELKELQELTNVNQCNGPRAKRHREIDILEEYESSRNAVDSGHPQASAIPQ